MLAGDAENDFISGGPGFDFITGGGGNDHLDGGSEDDSCFGGDGADTIVAGAGDDIADGGAGPDTIDGNVGRDILVGGRDRDFLSGGSGEDILIGADVSFPLVHESLEMIWLEWTSGHVFGIRARNVLGYKHPTSDQRLNGNEFLICGVTVGHDGALDTIDAGDGEQDLLLIDTFDAVLDDPIDVSTCD